MRQGIEAVWSALIYRDLFRYNGAWIGACLEGGGTKYKSGQYHAELTQNNNTTMLSSIFEEPRAVTAEPGYVLPREN